MFESFMNSIRNISFQIEKGRYLSYYKLYKDLSAIESEYSFAYRHKAISYIEFHQLEDAVEDALKLFCFKIQELY